MTYTTYTKTRANANTPNNYVTVLDYGAVGDGVANDTDAVRSALQSGKPIDGGGLTYLVNATFTTNNLVRLSNCTIIHETLRTNSAGTMLTVDGCDGFVIDNVTFNWGSNPESPLNTGINGGINLFFTIDILDSSDFTVENCKFTGNGTGTFFRALRCEHFSVDNCHVYDNQTRTPNGLDDQLQGFTFLNCSNFTVSNSTSRNLATWDNRETIYGQPNPNYQTYQFFQSRGFSFSRSSDYSCVGCHSENVGQGFDITGSGTNTRFVVSACTATSCDAVGFKAANGPSFGTFDSCIAKDIGLYAFTFSGHDNADDPTPRYITFNNCKAINTGVVINTPWETPRAFGVLGENNALGKPQRCAINNCEVYNEDGVASTAFFSSLSVPDITTSNFENGTFVDEFYGAVTNNCFVASNDNILEDYTGAIGPIKCLLSLSTDTLFKSTDDAQWKIVEMDNKVSDNYNLNNQNENKERIYIRESGYYRIKANILTSPRPDSLFIRVMISGEDQLQSWNTNTGVDQGIPSTITTDLIKYIEKGQFVRIDLLARFGTLYNSTTSVSLREGSTISVEKVD